MKRSLAAGLLAVVLAIAGAGPDDAVAVSARLVGFDEMVQQASVIVQGRVLKLESVVSGGPGVPGTTAREKNTVPPAIRPETATGQQSATAVAPPVGVGTKGGRMIFTLVTMETLAAVQGAPGNVVEFYVAGGTVDGRVAVVPGTPKFEVGETYFLFLRNRYWEVGDPIVGVNQGFFRVQQDPQSGAEVLLRANADHVLGIENDRIVTRHNPNGSRALPQMIGPPTPDHPGVQSQASAEVQRYRQSTEPLMTVGQFVDAIRSRTRP